MTETKTNHSSRFNLKLNQSKIKAASCPFRLSRIISKEWTEYHLPNPYARTGSAFHKFAHNYISLCKERKESTMLGAVESLADSAAVQFNQDEEEGAQLTELGFNFANNFIVPLELKPISEFTLSADKNWRECREEDALWYGTPDLFAIDIPVAYLWDWKSGWKLPSLESCQKDLQLRLYSLLLLAKYPDIREFNLSYHYIRYGVDRSWTMDRDEVLNLKDYLKIQRKTIEMALTDPKPRVSSQCVFCENPMACPILKFDTAVTNKNEAKRAAENMVIMKACLQDIDRNMRTWVDANGPVEIGDQAIGYKPYPSTKFDFTLIYEKAKECGLTDSQILPYLGVNKAIIGKIAGRNKGLKKELLDTGVVTKKTRFGVNKKEKS